jgi:hypothetical protein
MTNILDHVARQSREFRPETIREFFALQLSRKLNDASNTRIYCALAESTSEEVLLRAFHQATRGDNHLPASERFQIALRRLTRQEAYDARTQVGGF